MAEAKHAFVDDYPYLVYSPNAETTSEGGSGGAGFPVVESDYDTGALSVTAGHLVELLNNSPVMLKYSDYNYSAWYMITTYNGYTFNGLNTSGENPEIMQWVAESADDYPTPNQG